MIDISVSGLNKFYGSAQILKDITFDIYRGEKVGLLGKNGCGKTTLFKILSGSLDYDSGSIVIPSDCRVGLIEQIPNYPAGFTVMDVLKTAFRHIDKLRTEIQECETRMQFDHSQAVMSKYSELTAYFELLGGYDTETELNKVANGLQISEYMQSQLFSSLSGGEKTRINLACTILQNTDILLLDEPTNHLDLDAVEWLEDYISKYRGSVLIISHDRYFLDKSVTRVLEIEEGKLDFYPGNYSFYITEKEKRYEEQLKKYEQEQKKIDQLSVTAERMHGWGMGNKKLQVRAFAIEKRIERMTRTERPKSKEQAMHAGFSTKESFGDDVMKIKDIIKTFGEKNILSNINLEVKNGDSIALLGDNGSGKTTLLKIITGELMPDGGYIRLGPSIKVGILPQIVTFKDDGRNLVDELIYELNVTPQTSRNHLASFKFTGEDVFKKIKDLSGGERTRLKLCLLMARNINFLILDEPTNHLDIASREWIEQAVEDFDGTLLFVSHDRYFINRFANRIWELKDMKITDKLMTFEQYRKFKASEVQNEQIRREKIRNINKKTPKGKNIDKQILEVEREIEKIESRLKEIDREVEIAAHDFQRLNDLYSERELLNPELLECYEKWDSLSNLKTQ